MLRVFVACGSGSLSVLVIKMNGVCFSVWL